MVNEKYRLFRNDVRGNVYYSVGISRKNKDGEWDKGYMPVRFKEKQDIPNATDIVVKKCFLSVYVKKDKTRVFYLVIQDFDLAD